MDNGKIFTRLACAKLNIRHLKARPYSPEAKGKVERRTVEGFLAELSLQKARDVGRIEQSIQRLAFRSNKPHSALDGKTPVDTFASDSASLHFHSLETLADASRTSSG